MNVAKEKQLLALLIRICQGARVGPDLELAEVAARKESQLTAELGRIDESRKERHAA